MMRKRWLSILIAVTVFAFAGCAKTPKRALSEDAHIVSFGTPTASVDFIDGRFMNTETLVLLSSLKAIVNRDGARLYVAESAYDWASDLGFKITVYTDPYELVRKYSAQIKGVVLYDKNNPCTLDLAFAAASLDGLLVCSYLTYGVLAANGYEPTVKEDYRNRFATSQMAYTYMYATLWPHLSKRAIAFLSPQNGGGVRDYLTATYTAAVCPSAMDDGTLSKFVSDLSDDAIIFSDGLQNAPAFSLETLYTRGCENLMFFSGLGKSYGRNSSAPALQNKVYVAIVLSYEDDFSALFGAIRNNDFTATATQPVTIALDSLSVSALPALHNWHVWAYDNCTFMAEPLAVREAAQEKLPILLNEKMYLFEKYNKYIPAFLAVKLNASRVDTESLNAFIERAHAIYGVDLEFVSYPTLQALQAQTEVAV